MSQTETWRGEPLPRGRHKLSPEVVRASQRERLVRAMVESVAERGYAATTVPEVVATARVSRNAFYDHFSDKTECFIAACDEEAGLLLDALLDFVSEPDWVEALRGGLRAYLAWWRDRPAFSRAYFLELPSAGPRAIEQRERAYERFREMWRALGARARAEQPELPPLRDIVPRVLTSAITELVAEEVREGRTERLDRLHGDLLELMVRLLADDATARRVAS